MLNNNNKSSQNAFSPGNKVNVPKLKQISYKIHIGVTGDDKCGKTSLINTFISKSFNDPKQSTIICTQRITLTIENTPVECIISELNIAQNQNDQVVKNYIKNIDVFFLCHEVTENDEKFNEEIIKRYISFISNIKDNKEYIIYVVGCKLDQKISELKAKSAFIMDQSMRLTNYGQRVKTFINTNPIKKFYLTSSLLNYNIHELFEDAILSFGYKEYQKMKSNDQSNTRRSHSNEDDFYENCYIF